MWAQRETLWNTFCLDQVEVTLPKVYLLGNWNTDGSTILSPSQAALPMRFSCEFDSVIGAVLSSSTLSILIWNTSALPPDSSPELLMFLSLSHLSDVTESNGLWSRTFDILFTTSSVNYFRILTYNSWEIYNTCHRTHNYKCIQFYPEQITYKCTYYTYALRGILSMKIEWIPKIKGSYMLIVRVTLEELLLKRWLRMIME